MKKILCALLALAMVFSLAACGAKEEPATHNDAGYYAIFSLTEDGETMGREVFDAIGWTAFLQLDEDGTGVLDMGDGDVTQLTWQDGSLTAEGDTVTYVLAGGMLTLDLSDDDGETVMIFQKGEPPTEEELAARNAPAAPAEPAADPTEPVANDLVGTYQLTSMNSAEEEVTSEDIEMLESIGLTCELVLSPDGTGALVLFGESTDLTWDDASVTIEGETVGIVKDGDTLTISENDETLVFTKISDVAELPAEEPAAEPGEVPALPQGDFTPVGGDVGDYHVEIVGAEAFKDSDDKDAVRFYYDFTNNSDELTSPWLPLYLNAEEDGYQLVTTYAPWGSEVPEDDNEDLYVQPGGSIRCVQEYTFQTTGSVLTFEISDYGDDPVTAVFDVQALPGRPTWELEITPIPDPQFFADYSSEGADDNIAAEILDAEVAADYDTGEDCVRVFFSVTNNTEEAQSPLWLTTVRAYQDGVQLPDGYTEDEDGMEDAYYDDVAPGETAQFAYAWRLRSDSPVEVTLQDYVDYSSDVLIAGTVTLE